MKKLLLFLFLVAAFPFAKAHAEVTSPSQLFGTWQWTATIELTDAGQEYADLFSDNCEVTITSHSLYDLSISNFAGATTPISANFYDATQRIRFMNTSVNNPWGSGIDISNEDASEYTYNPYFYLNGDEAITFTTFTIVKATWNSEAFEYDIVVLATVSNGYLSLIEREELPVSDMSGDWHFTASGSYDESEFPTEFDMVLEASDDTYRAYTATLTFEGYDPVVFDEASYDGDQLSLPFNDTYIDAENKIAFYKYNSSSREGSIDFKMVSDLTLNLSSGMMMRQEVTYYDDELASYADSVRTVQYYVDGVARKQVDAYDFSGTYHITVGSIVYAREDYVYPESFDMEITYNTAAEKYYITSFLGNDTYTMNSGGIPAVATTTEEGDNVLKIAVGVVSTSSARRVTRLDDDGTFKYHVLFNGLGLDTDSIKLTASYDGTLSMEDFTLFYWEYGSTDAEIAVLFQNLTITKADVEVVDFEGTYTATTGTLEIVDNQLEYDYPETFDVEIVWNESAEKYYIYTFLSEDVYAINYGGISAVVSDSDPNELVISGDKYIKTIVAGDTYLKLRDIDGGTNSLSLVAQENGTFALDDFSVYVTDWNVGDYIAAKYYNVTLTPKTDDGDEPEPSSIGIVTSKTNSVKAYASNGTIFVVEGPTYVEVYNAAGMQVFAGTTSEISGLGRGVYFVKIGQTVNSVIL